MNPGTKHTDEVGYDASLLITNEYGVRKRSARPPDLISSQPQSSPLHRLTRQDKTNPSAHYETSHAAEFAPDTGMTPFSKRQQSSRNQVPHRHNQFHRVLRFPDPREEMVKLTTVVGLLNEWD